MKFESIIFALLLLAGCNSPDQTRQPVNMEQAISSSSFEGPPCAYQKDFEHLGNSVFDTIRVGNSLVDPIDDAEHFRVVEFGFAKRGEETYKKAVTHRRCGGEPIDVEFYQEFTNQIDLKSYQEYSERFFTTKDKVFFWWVNSDGHLIVPIKGADPETFQPFSDLCGGTDQQTVYYGCPNHGVNRLNIPVDSEFEFVAKSGNYWNSPQHWLVVEDEVYNVEYELEKGYFCELDKAVSMEDISKLKGIKIGD